MCSRVPQNRPTEVLGWFGAPEESPSCRWPVLSPCPPTPSIENLWQENLQNRREAQEGRSFLEKTRSPVMQMVVGTDSRTRTPA